MTSTLVIIVIFRIIFDFLSVFRPNPIYDVMCFIILLIAGILLLGDTTADNKQLFFGGILIVLTVVWGAYKFVKMTNKTGNSNQKSDDK